MRTRFVTLGASVGVFVAMIAGGCTGTGTSRPAPSVSAARSTGTEVPALDRSIRSFDFANAVWPVYRKRLRLTDGRYSGGEGIFAFELRIRRAPVFSDADADGDEDAFLPLVNASGNGFTISWYVWLWRDGSAVPMEQTVHGGTRCHSDTIETVNPVADGFEILAVHPSADRGCVESNIIPVTYVLGVRDGFLARIRPRFGPIEYCPATGFTTTDSSIWLLHVRATPRIAPDDNAPVVVGSREFKQISVRTDAESSDPGGVPGRWRLALLDTGDDQVCGWIETPEGAR